jgi:hypothetical protein
MEHYGEGEDVEPYTTLSMVALRFCTEVAQWCATGARTCVQGVSEAHCTSVPPFLGEHWCVHAGAVLCTVVLDPCNAGDRRAIRALADDLVGKDALIAEEGVHGLF